MSDLRAWDERWRKNVAEVVLEDVVIQQLIRVAKVARSPLDTLYRPVVEPHMAHRTAEVLADGEDGSLFKIRVRQLIRIPTNFSVILCYQLPNQKREFRLTRNNGGGQGKPHRNFIEKNEVRGPHIHLATERYQRRGADEDHFAIETDRFATLEQAIDCLINDCAIVEPKGAQKSLRTLP
jgi:hypothetical protein